MEIIRKARIRLKLFSWVNWGVTPSSTSWVNRASVLFFITETKFSRNQILLTHLLITPFCLPNILTINSKNLQNLFNSSLVQKSTYCKIWRHKMKGDLQFPPSSLYPPNSCSRVRARSSWVPRGLSQPIQYLSIEARFGWYPCREVGPHRLQRVSPPHRRMHERLERSHQRHGHSTKTHCRAPPLSRHPSSDMIVDI